MSVEPHRRIFLAAYGPGPHPCCFCLEKTELDGTFRRRLAVHHRNGHHADNRLRNLAPSHVGCHAAYHNAGHKYQPGDPGGGFRGKKHTDETRAKMRAAWVRRKARA